MSSSPILMPKLGLTMEEGLLAEWRVNAGDSVKAGDVLFVVETDKIANEVEAREAGTILAIAVPAGETVAVGTVLATWTGPSGAEPSATPSAPAPEAADLAPKPAPAPAPAAPQGSRILATPYARRLAREGGVPLEAVAGTGPRGRIKAADVERSRSAPPAISTPATTPAPVHVIAQADVTRLAALLGELAAECPAAGWTFARALAAACALVPGVVLAPEAPPGPAVPLPVPLAGQGAVLAAGPRQPVLRPGPDGAPARREEILLVLACDPALHNPAAAAALLNRIVEALHQPMRLLLA